jgi:hypothetical protein
MYSHGGICGTYCMPDLDTLLKYSFWQMVVYINYWGPCRSASAASAAAGGRGGSAASGAASGAHAQFVVFGLFQDYNMV